MKEIFLMVLIPISIYTIQTRKLRNAVIALCALSLVSSIVYLLMNAPDVAVAEAVIGTTLSTILYLVALKKYKVFTVYYLIEEDTLTDNAYFQRTKNSLTHALEKFCAKQELELHIVYSIESLDYIVKRNNYSIIIKEVDKTTLIYGHPDNFKMDALTEFLALEKVPHVLYKLEEVQDEA